jgi:hypothetical protein
VMVRSAGQPRSAAWIPPPGIHREPLGRPEPPAVVPDRAGAEEPAVGGEGVDAVPLAEPVGHVHAAGRVDRQADGRRYRAPRRAAATGRARPGRRAAAGSSPPAAWPAASPRRRAPRLR